MRKVAFAVVLAACVQFCWAQRAWDFVEDSHIKGSIRGRIEDGYVFKINFSDFYVISERFSEHVITLNPKVRIFRNGFDYKLEIQDVEHPVICRKLSNVIETEIDGDFKGWDGETVFRMKNGQVWKQAAYAYYYYYSNSPAVLIYEFNHLWMMKVEDVEEVLEVKSLD